MQTVDRTLATYLNAKQDVFSLQARAPEYIAAADGPHFECQCLGF